MASKTVLGYRMAALLALALAVGACGSSGSSGTSSGSTTTGSAATSAANAASARVPYTGPEANLPHAYSTPKIKNGLSCRLGYMNISAAIASLEVEQQAAAAEAKRLGCSFVALNDQLTLTTQVNDFNQLIEQHVNAILTYPIVPKALAPEVAKANAAHIIVVGQNNPVAAGQPLPSGYSTDILQGFDTTAYDRVKDVAAHAPGASFGIVGLAQPVASLQYLDERTKYWAAKFGLKFVGESDAQQDDPAAAATAASGLLAKYPSIKVIFAYNDNAAVATATVARSTNHSSVLIVGSNGQAEALNDIKAGTMFSTSQQNFDQVGKQMVDAAYDVLSGVQVPKFVVVGVTEINKSNVASITPIG